MTDEQAVEIGKAYAKASEARATEADRRQAFDWYICRECANDEIVGWSLQDYAERGSPVCPCCDGDMEKIG
jgi:hypothetical protein